MSGWPEQGVLFVVLLEDLLQPAGEIGGLDDPLVIPIHAVRHLDDAGGIANLLLEVTNEEK